MKTTHPLKIVGEVQMKALSHDMGVLRRDNELLREQAKELLAALKNLLRDEKLDDDNPRLMESRDQARAAISKATA